MLVGFTFCFFFWLVRESCLVPKKQMHSLHHSLNSLYINLFFIDCTYVKVKKEKNSQANVIFSAYDIVFFNSSLKNKKYFLFWGKSVYSPISWLMKNKIAGNFKIILFDRHKASVQYAH